MYVFRAVAAIIPLACATSAISAEDGQKSFEESFDPCHSLADQVGKKLGAYRKIFRR